MRNILGFVGEGGEEASSERSGVVMVLVKAFKPQPYVSPTIDRSIKHPDTRHSRVILLLKYFLRSGISDSLIMMMISVEGCHIFFVQSCSSVGNGIIVLNYDL